MQKGQAILKLPSPKLLSSSWKSNHKKAFGQEKLLPLYIHITGRVAQYTEDIVTEQAQCGSQMNMAWARGIDFEINALSLHENHESFFFKINSQLSHLFFVPLSHI